MKRMLVVYQTEGVPLSLAKQDTMLYGVGSSFWQLCKDLGWKMKRYVYEGQTVIIVLE